MIRITIEQDEWVVLLPPEKCFEHDFDKKLAQTVTEYGRILRGKLSGPWKDATASYTERFEDWAEDILVKTYRVRQTGNYYIRNSINAALIALEQQAPNAVTDDEIVELELDAEMARVVAKSDEFRAYVREHSDALAAIVDQRNPNRRYSLTPFLYGLRLRIKGADSATCGQMEPGCGNVLNSLIAEANRPLVVVKVGE